MQGGEMSSAQRDLEARDHSEVSIEGIARNNYVVLVGMERNRGGYRQVVGQDVRRMVGSNFAQARGLSGIRRAVLVPIVRNYRSSRSPRFWPSFPKGNWVESGGTIEDQREQTSGSDLQILASTCRACGCVHVRQAGSSPQRIDFKVVAGCKSRAGLIF
jgi:hypothetical protein